MKPLPPVVLFIIFWMLAAEASGQIAARHDRNSFNRISVDEMDNIGKMKLLAERGNVMAQLKIANICLNNHLNVDALKWYSAAAEQGQQEAIFQKGHLLLYGANNSILPNQSVPANAIEGLKLVYKAATNHHQDAWYDMGEALRTGNGCNANPIAAYGWYSLGADANIIASKKAMNEIALHLTTEEIRQALAGARELKAGKWQQLPPPAIRCVAAQAVPLKLKFSGVSASPRGNLAIINNRTLSIGEATQFMTEEKEMVRVTCLNIQSDYAEVQVFGEAQSRVLLAGAH